MTNSLKLSRSLVLALGLTLGSTYAMAGAYDDLIAAAYRDDTDAVTDLINRGLDVNSVDPAGNTLLHVAARSGNIKLMETLLKSNANPKVRNRVGDTAVMLAAYGGKMEAVDVLLAHGADLNNSGWTPLHYAVFAQQAEMVSHLLAKGALINARAPNEQTALMLVAKNGDINIARILLKANPDIDLKDQYGETALSIAGKNNNGDIARLLENASKKAAQASETKLPVTDSKPVSTTEPPKAAPVKTVEAKPVVKGADSGEYVSPPFQTEKYE
jgi:ankyrin repeat protein